MRAVRVAALVLVTGWALLGCDTTTPVDRTPPPPTVLSNAVAADVVVADLVPTRIEIDRIGVSSSLIPLGLDAAGGWAVPDVPEQASWYSEGPMPGQPGPAVILGHVDGDGRAGVFARLHELVAGDTFTVMLAGGATVEFVVATVQQVPKDEFPTAAVLAPTSLRQLALITCGGEFSSVDGSHRDNIILYAAAVVG